MLLLLLLLSQQSMLHNFQFLVLVVVSKILVYPFESNPKIKMTCKIDDKNARTADTACGILNRSEGLVSAKAHHSLARVEPTFCSSIIYLGRR